MHGRLHSELRRFIFNQIKYYLLCKSVDVMGYIYRNRMTPQKQQHVIQIVCESSYVSWVFKTISIHFYYIDERFNILQQCYKCAAGSKNILKNFNISASTVCLQCFLGNASHYFGWEWGSVGGGIGRNSFPAKEIAE